MEYLIFPKNEEKAHQMAAYMKNQFSFAGMPKPERWEWQKAMLLKSKKMPLSELLFITSFYYEKSEREYQYLAIDLIQQNIKRLTLNELVHLMSLVQEKEWWDTIDAWRKVYSTWCKLHMDQLETVSLLFEKQEDFWLRRIAITLQLGFKEETNVQLLERVILEDQSTKEFFIEKAIGWALRDYSKTNAVWVKEQLTRKWHALTIREASKYL
ncbi:DNA alkylation repair protein [Enterococcus villorum]|uniref:DNA-7-methylguanine glycosylase n=2 Tax=Enterococcus villorum TaxID=112904 RepID=A0A511J2B4_9ENTE|nr:DNA alkylation repair protein [Enterococcus villorum]EOH91403.1 DNA alkylation repair protein [Enterococcus villorum ATCC 700913]EOW76781.1 DNA alkylation repair protein [Enterococcus villorum ATCC 700913]GEL91819.1 DNA-7-methylguanine glycosylase [Enterococcus villorum]